jgi:hypothetical protein
VTRDGVTTLCSNTVNFFGHPVSTEHEATDANRNEATWVRTAPLFDLPVVVSAGHRRYIFVVGVLHEELTTHSRP